MDQEIKRTEVSEGNYCCFFCPERDRFTKQLSDKCPSCGRSYEFALLNLPNSIRNYNVIKPLGRGFYGAAYIAEAANGLVTRKCVLKVTPVSFYSYFQKPSFEQEVSTHYDLAETASHVVGIIAGHPNEEIQFSDDHNTTLVCHVTVLDYVDGSLLEEYISGKILASSAEICQIAIDLLRIRAEFESNHLNHNDLHSENLIVEKLQAEKRRPNAVCDTIWVKAIDLGSVSEENKSGPERLGDVRYIARHVGALVDLFLKNPESVDDREYRISLALQGIVQGLSPSGQNLRIPDFENQIEKIYDAYNRAAHPWRPWKDPLTLRSVGDHYNAQTLESWHVPQLLVDPEDRWVSQIAKPGPQIITGMRGCGKTMLLRSLDIHARATKRDHEETSKQVLTRLRKDQFVGLFVSAQRLLDLRSQSLYKIEHRLSRLFVCYALQAARALLHLRDVDEHCIVVGAHSKLASAVENFLEGTKDLRSVVSLDDLERYLTGVLVKVVQEPEHYSVAASPSDAFSHLAEEFRSCADVISSCRVFFLLDDVSTRYLEISRVEEILSRLLFQSPVCGFKFTSEWQTIELGLTSPGRTHPIREDRDIIVFDLGADVYSTIGSRGGSGKSFVSSILEHRAKLLASHPSNLKPSDLLGDVPLEQIAREIASEKSTSKARKSVYRGLTCLTNVCVGDIGDIIKLYEEILRRYTPPKELPIPQSIQTECFRLLSSRRLYELNRRNVQFKDHALGFAEASHELLVRSYRKGFDNGTVVQRLRQYSSIYVRVTADEESQRSEQIDRLRELIDSSVFVFAGGAPRTKTRDSNPIQQFILSFRKIYGINSFIGLADRDRFELSGKDLEEWLSTPGSAKTILLRNQIKGELGEYDLESKEKSESQTNAAKEAANDDRANDKEGENRKEKHGKKTIYYMKDLFDQYDNDQLPESSLSTETRPKRLDFHVVRLEDKDLLTIPIQVVLTGLGFEDRALASNKYIAERVQPEIVYSIRYSLQGNADEIKKLWSRTGRRTNEIEYSTSQLNLPKWEGLTLVDVSGLTKPAIYEVVRNQLRIQGRVLICHATAAKYYPLEEQLESLFAASQMDEPQVFLESLSDVLTGERGPYSLIKLLNDKSDPTRNRALVAFGSSKHERLFTLLDRREFDHIDVIVSNDNTPATRVAAFAAEFICGNYPNARVTEAEQSSISSLVDFLDDRYIDIFSRGGANFELGLTGSKIQAVAAAVVSAGRKVTQAWYVSPKEFDEIRFTSGVGALDVYDIVLHGENSIGK